MAFLPVRSIAPDFIVNDQDGQIVKLSDFRGRKVVLFFYPKDLTPTCTTEACNLRDNYKMLLKQGYEVLGISTDTEKSHRKFIEKEKLPFRLLADTDKKIHDAYGTWIQKSMYGREFMGTARITYIINESGIIQDVIEKVVSKEHSAQIVGTFTTNKKGAASVSKPSKKAVKKSTTKKN